MKIFCLCLVKDEDDILQEAVVAATCWADGIFLSDNGSTDDTPAVIQRLTRRYPHVFDIGPLSEPFTDALRAKMFARVRPRSARGDWWCRLDADEIYIDDPRDFLSQLPGDIDTVWTSTFHYYFTQPDLQKYEADPAGFLRTPVTERLRYYRNDWSEIRFVRHAFPFIWRDQWPSFRCSAARRRIRLRHYQYRGPEQIQKRLRQRREVAARTGGKFFPHELPDRLNLDGEKELRTAPGDNTSSDNLEYLQRVVSPEGLDYYSGGSYVERENDLPPIRGIRPSWIPPAVWKPLCIARAVAGRMRGSGARV